MSENTDAEPSLSELIAARDDVRRQIDVLRAGSPLYARNRGAQVGGLIAELEGTLRELEQCIAEWKPD